VVDTLTTAEFRKIATMKIAKRDPMGDSASVAFEVDWLIAHPESSTNPEAPAAIVRTLDGFRSMRILP
jgi:hypothetical protein